MAFSGDGPTLATAGSDGTGRLRDVDTGESTATLTGHDNAVNSVAFGSDGATVATASDDHTAYLWAIDRPCPK